MNESQGVPVGVRFLILGIVVVLFIGVFGALIGGCSSLNRPGPTEVALIRNGGPLDDKSIREVRSPNSAYAVSGLFSEPRMYIAGCEQRYYSVGSDPSLGGEAGANSFIEVPTRDGVEVGIDAQILFRTAFTNRACDVTEESEALLRSFDERFGNRTFETPGGDSAKVWEGTAGWEAFLDRMVRPIVENAFREEIGSVNCADLISSCALVQSSGEVDLAALAERDNSGNFNRIQKNVQAQIDSGVLRALGEEYLRGFRVQLTKVTLPKDVQVAINQAQASFAQIAESRAQKVQAQYQAEANERLAAAYRNNPGLAYVQAAKELAGNSSATIILGEPGAGLNLGK